MLQAAYAPMSVTLTLEDEIDISRGDMLASAAAPPHVARVFEAIGGVDEREAAGARTARIC